MSREIKLRILREARKHLWNGKGPAGQRSICAAIGEATRQITSRSPLAVCQQYETARGELATQITKRTGWTVRWWLYDNWLRLPLDLQMALAPHGVRPRSRNAMQDRGVQLYRMAFLEELIREHSGPTEKGD